MWRDALRATDGGTVLRIEVVPGSSEEGWKGYDRWREAFKIKVREAPRRGRANEALVRLVAKTLRVPDKDVDVQSGLSSRLKEVRIRNVEVETVTSRLREVLGP